MLYKNTEIRVSEAFELLKKGKTRKEILQHFAKLHNAKQRSVDGYLKLARPLHEAYLQSLSQKLDKKQEEVIMAIETENVLSVIEKRTRIASIVRNELELDDVYLANYEGQVISKDIKRKPDFKAVLAAIELDNTMTGDIAPKKQAILLKQEAPPRVVIRVGYKKSE